MATFEDLSPLTYVPGEPGEAVLAVGWLGRGVPYPTGEIDRVVFDRFQAFVAAASRVRTLPWTCMGYHECDLCQFDGPLGKDNAAAPGAGCLFVVPELIVHYVAAHRYRPPQVFCDALMASPDPGTAAYRQAFLENGGRAWMRRS